MTRPGEVAGEGVAADPRERRLRALAQLADKPLTMALVGLAFTLAVRGPEWITGDRPSGWTVLGVWIGISALARIAVVSWLRRFRARHGIDGPVEAPDRTETRDAEG